MSEAPESDAVVLVDVKPVRGVEDPKLVAELRQLSKELGKPRKKMSHYEIDKFMFSPNLLVIVLVVLVLLGMGFAAGYYVGAVM